MSFDSVSQKQKTLVLSTCLGVAVLVALMYLYDFALHFAIQNLLAQHLPTALNDALVNSYDVTQLLVHSESVLKRWIESVHLFSVFGSPIINNIEILEISLTAATSQYSADLLFKLGDEHYALNWIISSPISNLTLSIMIAISALCAASTYCVLHSSATKRSTLSPVTTGHEYDAELEQLPSQKDSLSVETATDNQSEPGNTQSVPTSLLTINLLERSISLDGHTLLMPKTPFFYYYWYVKRSIDDLPAYINPSISKPDIEKGQELAQIMRCFGGHARAINELELHGLKAKTLDQNRNKIKDEMLAHFGELANPYLFQKSRDPKTGRYQHQLSQNIFIIKTDS